MPQFDFFSFSTQVFYVLLGFSFFHFFILNYVVVLYARVLKLRYKLYNIYLNKSFSSKKLDKNLYDAFISLFFKNF